jgi:sugar phosphate isomerase/epimerase
MNRSRRDFMVSVGTAGAAAAITTLEAAPNDPIRRLPPARMKLSLAAYSFRDYLAGKNKSMSYEQWMDLVAGYGTLDAIEPTGYYFPENATAEYMRGFRRRAFLLGLDISGTAIGNVFTHPAGVERDKQLADTRKWIDRAAALGAPVIRIFAGNLQKGTTEADARKWAIDAIHESCRYAGERGVILALENHGGIVTTIDQILSIVKEVQSPWFGVNLDSGNFRSADPYGDLAKLAPYAVTAQIKAEITPGGTRQEADYARLIDILRKSGYRGYVALEYEAKEDPKTAVPRHLEKLRKLIG